MKDAIGEASNAVNGRRDRGARYVIPARRVRGAQFGHFAMCHVLPGALIVGLPALMPGMIKPTAWSLLLWAVMWTLTGGAGISVGYHRLYAHRSFTASTVFKYLLTFCGGMAAQGPVMYWVALHRRHHALADLPGDPHSPAPASTGHASPLLSFLSGHLLWAFRHDVPMPSRYVPDLLKDPAAKWSQRIYPLAVLTGLAVPAAIGAAIEGGWAGALNGVYWGGLVRLVVGHHLIWSINSFGHALGRRSHDTPDASRNVAWLALPTFGESWHNNHHAAPTSACFAREVWRLDSGWWMVRLARWLGHASNVRTARQ